MTKPTAPNALKHLHTFLRRNGIHPMTDRDGPELAFLHIDCISISATEQHYRIEHINRSGDAIRTITLAHARIDDALRLVSAYLATRHQHPKPRTVGRSRLARGRRR
ncbi:hypothetical protein [Nocardiopsis rhodophaea]|uniref:hypothetical protein n=1 Tax=Nocardiopsis rhodophaea TaxID=280238 RepID=UPI0031D10450